MLLVGTTSIVLSADVADMGTSGSDHRHVETLISSISREACQRL